MFDLIAVHTAEHLESHAQLGGLAHVYEPYSPSTLAHALPTNRKLDHKDAKPLQLCDLENLVIKEH